MNDALQYSRLAVQLLAELDAVELGPTDDRLKQQAIVLAAFAEVDHIVEQRLLALTKQPIEHVIYDHQGEQ